MHFDHAKALLMFIQAGDHRNVDDVTINLWASEIPDNVEAADAFAAVRMFRARPDSELARFPYLDLPTFRSYHRRALEARRVETRRQAALGAAPAVLMPPVTQAAARAHDPEAFDEAFNEGRRQAAADRAYRRAKLDGATETDARAAGQDAYQNTKKINRGERATHAETPARLGDIQGEK